MKALATLLGTMAPATAFAASNFQEDNSGIFVWVFLGFCALIVVVQVIPALLLFFGLAKGLAAKAPQQEAEAVKAKRYIVTSEKQ